MSTPESRGKINSVSLEEFPDPADVLLVVPPLAGITVPMLGIHLLQAGCRAAGIKTGALYTNFLYANLIGLKLHKILAGDYYLLLGERLFASTVFDQDPVSIARVKDKFLSPTWVPDHIRQIQPHIKNPKLPQPVVLFKEWLSGVDLEQLESLSADWVRGLAGGIVKTGSRIVGCTTTLGGLLPAAAVLSCIKKANPGVITVLGGSLCEAEMAEGLLSLNTGIDYIFSGEGEITFPLFVKQVLEGHLPGEKIIRGQEVTDLDTTPLPDYHEYFQQKEKFSPPWPGGKNNYVLPFETSRGCWYGKCFFCGLNGKRNIVRKKSPDRIIQNLKALVEQHDINYVAMADNMMPYQYFDTLLPRLSNELPSIKIFYQMKANVTLDQVMALKKAGVSEFQVGIEALSPSLLRRMNKPYTLRGNIAALRYARSVGIDLEWALLFGFPGDQTGEYRETLDLVSLIRHLQPPRDIVPLVLYRYSQYQQEPGKFGISGLHPAEVFKEILPAGADLDKIAYYFTGRFPSQCHENPGIITALWEEFQAWHQAWAAYKTIPLDTLLPTLHVTRKTPKQYVLEDTRGLPGLPKRREINKEQATLLLVARPLEAVPDVDVRQALDDGLAVVRESWFIPLATAEPALLQELEYENEKNA